jgi:L-alanine-DL-glutamate epimerase-like enolase superfamily enzyme
MRTKLGGSALPIEHIAVSAYTVPTDFPESDGTLDLDRVRAARKTIGSDAELFVDANGAYSRKHWRSPMLLRSSA